MKRACEQYLARGFTAIKFGWGVFGQDPKRDVALVKAAREAIGPDVDLLVDAGWRVNRSPYDAIELIRRLEPYRIFWLEDFLHPECYEGYAAVKAAGVKTRLAAGEQEATAWGFHELIHRGRVDVVQPDLSRCGGFTQFRKIVWEAERAGADVCPHAWLTDLLTAASLHANACLPRSLFLEYNVSSSPMLREIIANPIQMDTHGTIPVPQGPGLGVEMDEKAVERYRVG
jgi:L-alanine-DL-glutamate epimerase-like enolase superfamily enzyme